MRIDNQYYEWYLDKFSKKLDKSYVLPVLRALQGHHELGKLQEKHINSILMGLELNFKHTTHDRTIYKTTFKGHKVLILCQVDDLMIQTDDEDIAI